jgi:hypothetical protein
MAAIVEGGDDVSVAHQDDAVLLVGQRAAAVGAALRKLWIPHVRDSRCRAGFSLTR